MLTCDRPNLAANFSLEGKRKSLGALSVCRILRVIKGETHKKEGKTPLQKSEGDFLADVGRSFNSLSLPFLLLYSNPPLLHDLPYLKYR